MQSQGAVGFPVKRARFHPVKCYKVQYARFVLAGVIVCR